MIVGPRGVVTDMSASTTTVRTDFSASRPPFTCTTLFNKSFGTFGTFLAVGAFGTFKLDAAGRGLT